MADVTTITRSRKCGLKDVYVAKVTANDKATYTATSIMKLARAISAKVTDNFTREKIYSDDNVEDIVDSYEGTDIELEVNALAAPDYAYLFNNLYKNGYLVKSADDLAQEVALGYRCKQRNGKYEFVWFYCGKFERPEANETSQKEKIEVASATLKGAFYQREKIDTIDGLEKNLYQIVVDETNLVAGDVSAKTAITDWFAKVQEYSGTETETFTYTATGTVTDISLTGVTYNATTKLFTVPNTATTFTFKDSSTTKTATKSSNEWSVA